MGGAAVTGAGFVTGVDVLGVFVTGAATAGPAFVFSRLLDGNVVAVDCVLVADPFGLLMLEAVGATG